MWNGTGNLTVHLPNGVSVNQRLKCEAVVVDDTLISPFVNQFNVLVEEKAKPTNNAGGGIRKKSNGTNDKETEKLSSLALPDVIEVRQPEWLNHKFDKFSAMKVRDNGEGGYDFFVNMDNVFLLTELKSRGGQDPKLLDAQYKYALVLIALALLKDIRTSDETGAKEGEEITNIFDDIEKVSRALSPVILPMITYLGELELETEEIA